MFKLVVTARMKARREQIVTTGWWSGFASRVSDLKTPAHWLEPPKPQDERARGAAEVRAMLRRMERKAKAAG